MGTSFGTFLICQNNKRIIIIIKYFLLVLRYKRKSSKTNEEIGLKEKRYRFQGIIEKSKADNQFFVHF
jgi:hypothetical protein